MKIKEQLRRLKKGQRPVSVNGRPVRRRMGFELTPNAIVYAVIFVAALIFTQALRSNLSNIFFVFVILLPPTMIVYVLIARASLNIFKLSEPATIEKLQPYTYEFKIINNSILPYPFIDAYMELPQANCVRTGERLVRLSMPPVKEYRVKNTVSFRFRGTYDIGVNCFYVYDFFRMFRMRIGFYDYDTIYVMPRKLYLNEGVAQATSDEADRTRKSPYSYDRIEISDIRDYHIGDSLKSIHWKLSSKSEEFLVRDYDSGTTRSTYIFADMSARYASQPSDESKDEKPETDEKAITNTEAGELADALFYEDMNEYCADGVCELTVAAVLRELRAGNICSLFWFDRRDEIGACGYTIRSMEDFSSIYKMFATAPLCAAENTLTKLSSMVKEMQNIKLLFVTSAVDPGAMSEYARIAEVVDGVSSGAAEIILYNPIERYLYPRKRQVYVENCREELANHGLKLIDGKLQNTPST